MSIHVIKEGSTAKVSMWNMLIAISLLDTAIILRENETSILVIPFIRKGNTLGGLSLHPFSKLRI
jgi:hypothetical protein